MDRKINLPQRLKKVAIRLPAGSIFADIGSDHAYLPCYVCLADPQAKAIAGEVNEGPYRNAVQTVEKYHLHDRISVRMGNGLEIFQKGEIHQLVITGMGGGLIRSILESGSDKLSAVNRIIVQPNNGSKTVRSWLIKQNYRIIDEDILEEHGHIYEIVVADRTEIPICLTEKEQLFGPVLMEKQSDVFIKKWKYEYEKYKHIIKEMNKAKNPDDEKIQRYQEEKKWMKEVIQLEE